MSKDKLIWIVLLLSGIFATFFIQFLTPTLYDADGYLHIRMATFLREFGPRYDFHWARYSTFSDNFSDKDFLFHVFLIPFTYFGNIFFGAKLVASFFAAVLFLGFYLILKRYSDKRMLVIFLLAFFLSDLFLRTISSPRPISIIILIMLCSIHLLINKREKALFFLGLFYALTHVTSPLIILYALIVETVRYFDSKEFYRKNVLAVFLGVLLGFIIHPNVPNNFIVFYLNSILVPLYTITAGVLELGAEFFPLDTRQVLLSCPVVVIGLLLLIYTSVSKRPKARFQTNVFLAVAGFYFILSFVCKRYLTHGYPIMLLALSSYFSDSLVGVKKINRKALVIIVIGMLILGLNSLKNIRYNAFVERIINTHYEQAGKFLEKNVPAGELIFHANWSDSQYFIGLNPKNDYFVTLDPVYMYKWNPELYKLYRDVSFGRTRDPYTVLKDTFKVKYGYIGKNYFSSLIDQVKQDKRFAILGEDNFGIIFKLL